MASRIQESRLWTPRDSSSAETKLLSRRGLLKASAATALLGYAGRGLLKGDSRFSIATGPGWLSLCDNEVEKFRLEAATYHGAVNLWHDVQTQAIAFGIRNARFPGTTIAADLTCELWKGEFGYQVLLTIEALGLALRGYAHDWLNRDGLKGHLSVSQRIIDRSDLSLTLHGGPVRLSAHGELQFHGRACATVQCAGHALPCDSLSLHLQNQGDSVLKNAASRRTRLLASRGTSHWPLQPPAGDWTYQTEDHASVFDSLEIEAHESTAHRHSYAAVAKRNAARRPVQLILNQTLAGTDRQSPVFFLSDLVYAQHLSGESDSMTVATLAEPARLQFGALQLRLSNPGSAPALRVAAVDDRVSASFKPDATMYGEIDEAIISPESTNDSWPIEIGATDKVVAAQAKAKPSASLQMRRGAPTITGSLILRITRPADFLDLTFELDNIHGWLEDGTLYIRKHDTALPALLIVHLGSQTLAEQAFPVSTPPNDDLHCTVQSRALAYLPKESRISLEILPDKDAEKIVDLDFLLGWQAHGIHVCHGQMPPQEQDKAPYTALVMPAGVTFSPTTDARFATPKRHPSGPFDNTERDTYSTHTGNTYRLWTGRLISDLNIIAVDSDKAGSATTFGLSDTDRASIAAQVIDSNPLPAQHVVVSTAGGWLKGHTRMTPGVCPTNLLLDSLRLNIAGGVELLEQVSYPIFLIPTGHRGSLVKTTLMQWCRDPDNDRLQGVETQRYNITISEKTRYYDTSTYWPASGGYPYPFKQVTIPIRETPTLYAKLAEPFASDDCSHCTDASSTPYWATILQPPDYADASATPFLFPIIGTDRDGVEHHGSMAMVIAAGIRAYTCTTKYIPGLLAAYKAGATATNSPDFKGENIAYAQSNKPGDAAYPTGSLLSYADAAPSVKFPLVPWGPKLTSAALALSTTGGFAQSGSAGIQKFGYSNFYCLHPFDTVLAGAPPLKSGAASVTPGNLTEILLISLDPPNPLNFYAKLGGGLFQPSTNVAALSRSVGNIFTTETKPITDSLSSITDMANGIFNAVEAFGSAAKLLGAVDLSDIIDPVSGIVQSAAAVPKLLSQELNQLDKDITPVVTELTSLATALQSLTLGDALKPLLNSIAPQVAYLRALVFEQIAIDPQYLAAASDVAYLQSLVGADPLAVLQQQLTASLAYRVQNTTTLIDAANANSIVTLNRIRDYLLNAALQGSDLTAPVMQVFAAFSADLATLNLADATAQSIATALTGDLSKLNTDLFGFQTLLQSVLTQAAGAYTSVQSTVTDLQAAIQNLTDPLSLVNALRQLATLLANLPNPIATLTPTMTGSLQAVVTQSTLVNTDVTQLFTDFNRLVALAAQDPTLKVAAQAAAEELSSIQQTLSNDFVLKATAFTTDAATGFAATLKVFNAFYATLQAAAAKGATALNAFLNTLTNLQQIRASYDYDTPLKSSDLFIASKDSTPASLALHTSVTVNVPGLSANPPSPNLVVAATVRDFTLLLLPEFPFLSVGFDSASFTSTNGSTPVVSCKLDAKSIQFIGPLNFVVQLAESISLPEGLSVQQTSDGVSIAFTLAVPSIEAGAFLMSNLSLYSGVALDFTGNAINVEFGFADPNHHFVMTYALFGGGGYLDFSFAPQRGLSALDISGALEFGAEAALDFGVASGDLYIFGGFLFNMSGDELDLGGYLRAGGDLNVLDLITASVEFSMSLAYENRSGTAWLVGECDITVDVDIAYVIDTSVDLRLHREFSNFTAN